MDGVEWGGNSQETAFMVGDRSSFGLDLRLVVVRSEVRQGLLVRLPDELDVDDLADDDCGQKKE